MLINMVGVRVPLPSQSLLYHMQCTVTSKRYLFSAFITQNTSMTVVHMKQEFSLASNIESKTFSDNAMPSSPKLFIHCVLDELSRPLLNVKIEEVNEI